MAFDSSGKYYDPTLVNTKKAEAVLKEFASITGGTQPTDVQQLKTETLRCKECEHEYDHNSPVTVLRDRSCYSCTWFPKRVLTDNFIQRKASAV